MTDSLLQAWANANPDCSIHDLSDDRTISPVNYFPNRLTDNSRPSPRQGAKDWEPVTRWTRASSTGRVIRCPHCGTEKRVYHFSWAAVTCQGCDRMVDKYDYTTTAK